MSNFRAVSILIAILVAASASRAFSAEPQGQLKPLSRAIDLNVGESQQVELSNGSKVAVKLVDLRETRDPIRDAVREAIVKVEVAGRAVELTSGNYNLPQTVGSVQIDCPITKGYNSNGSPESWALDKDARLRLWPAGSPLIQPGTFGYPAKQRWSAGLTQMANEPVYVDGGERPSSRKIYYHSGLDIGGCEGMIEVVAATDALVVSSGLEVMDEHRRDTPVSPRYDVVYLLDARGWYYRYSHMKEIDATVKPGRHLKLGDRIGSLGKEGGSGGWSHLHFEIKSRQPSGRWGTEEGYAFLWEAYVRQHQPQVIAVARPHHLIWAGEQVRLDGTKSWSANGRVTHEWRFSDGGDASARTLSRRYSQPGSYSEILKVTNGKGQIAYDFAIVQVLDREHPDRIPPTIHPAYAPTQGLRAGDEITFKVRTFRTTDGSEVWDFGDGTPTVEVRSDGNVRQLDPNGYAVTTHRYAKPGHYLVRVERTDRFGMKAVGRLDVLVTDGVPNP
jgi:murein DD-endopeptidase MepM/ murein hydrolase activator NlpD